MRLTFALLLASALPAAAAECPTRADLARGVTLVNTALGGSIHYVETAGQLVARSIIGGQPGHTITYAHPLALGTTETEDTRLTYRYTTDLAPLDRPETLPREGHFTVEGSVTNQDGKTFSLVIDWRYLGPGEVTVGKCRYETVELSYEEYVGDAFLRVYTRSFAPALGLVVQDVAFDPDTETSHTFGFDRIHAGDR